METIYTTPEGPSFGGNGYTRRHVIAASSLLSTATSVRVAFQHLAIAYTITEAYIGLQSTSGDAYDIDPATMVRLTQDGNNTLSISKTKYYSDEVPFTISGDRAIIISLYGATSQMYLAGAFPAGYTAYHLLGNYAGVADATSFLTSTSNVFGFLAIEGTRTQLSGTISVDEEVDDVAILSHTWNVGNVEITESIDDVSCQGVSYVCFANINEEIDDVSVSGWSAVAGISSIQEELDTIVASAYSPNIGKISVVEALDEISGFAFEAGSAIQGTITTEEYVDRVSIGGNNQADRIILAEGADDIGAASVTWNAGFVTILEYRDEVTTYAASGETRGPLAVHEALDGAAVSAYTSNVGRVVTSCGVDGVAAATEETVQAGNAIMAVIDPVDLVAIQTTTCIGAVARVDSSLDEVSLFSLSGIYGAVVLDESVDRAKLSSRALAGAVPLFEFTRPVADIDGDLPAPSPATVLRFNRPVPALGTLAKNTAVEPFHFSR